MEHRHITLNAEAKAELTRILEAQLEGLYQGLEARVENLVKAYDKRPDNQLEDWLRTHLNSCVATNQNEEMTDREKESSKEKHIMVILAVINCFLDRPQWDKWLRSFASNKDQRPVLV